MRSSSKIAKGLAYLAYCALLAVGFVAALEIFVRLSFPDVNTQGIEKALFRDGAFGPTIGLAPNTTQSAFGIPVSTDEYGFVTLPGAPVVYGESWLVLGDSVTFGIGVPAESSFLGLLQRSHPHVKIWNTSVPGYSVLDYANVLPTFLERHAVDRVIMFWCLNDVETIPVLTATPEASLETKVRDFLKTRLKSYMWVKHLVWDRPHDHYRGVLAMYENEEFNAKTRALLTGIRDLLLEKGKKLTVFVLPYEYQLRADPVAALAPQDKINRMLSDLGIEHHDLLPYLAASEEDPKALYLTADGLHFSVRGHELIFDFLQRSLGTEAALVE